MAARSQLEAAARPLGLQKYKTPYNTLYTKDSIDSKEIQDSLEYSLSVVENLFRDHNLMREFKEYLYNRLHSKHDANQLYNTFKRHGLFILHDPIYIARLRESTARRLLRSLAAVRDFLELLGYNVKNINDYIRQLRKLAPRKEEVKILEYEEKTEIINQVLQELDRLKKSYIWYIVGLTAFFSGLRGSEIVYLIRNYKRLKKSYHEGIVIVVLNYVRKSKKAYITMIPSSLEKYIIAISDQIGDTVIDNMRNKKGFHVGISRKAHVSILSDYLGTHEINLLQGRGSEIIVKHYTKHIRKISEKYRRAFIKYFYLISQLEG